MTVGGTKVRENRFAGEAAAEGSQHHWNAAAIPVVNDEISE